MIGLPVAFAVFLSWVSTCRNTDIHTNDLDFHSLQESKRFDKSLLTGRCLRYFPAMETHLAIDVLCTYAVFDTSR